MIPKSIAPSESRLAGISVSHIRIKAVNNDIGMVMVANSAPRGLPKKIISTPITNKIPKESVCEMVFNVASTSSVRS